MSNSRGKDLTRRRKEVDHLRTSRNFWFKVEVEETFWTRTVWKSVLIPVETNEDRKVEILL